MAIKNHGFTLIGMIITLLHAYAAIYFESIGLWVISTSIGFASVLSALVVSDNNSRGKDIEWTTKKK